jgi:hypothetical protein
MDIRRTAHREAQEKALQYKSQQDGLLPEKLHEAKLTQLMAFIRRLEETPPGVAELKERIKLFGKCKRIDGETSGHFYGRLRHWLDRDFPQRKSPRHAARQTDD